MKIPRILMVGVLALTGCSSTRMVSSWKAPDASVNPERLHKVMVVALVRDESARRIAEDKMASYNKSFRVSYHDFNSKEAVSDEKRCRAVLKKQGFDGIVTMRLLAKKSEETYVQGYYVPGSYSGGYGGYHSAFYSGYYLPGYYRTDTKYWIETKVFSLKRDKLLWSGVAYTANPERIDKAVGEVLDQVRKQMIKDRFISDK